MMRRLSIICAFNFILIFLVTCKNSTESEEPEKINTDHSTMYVKGRYLYNSYGDTVILRGVNRMVYYMDTEGTESYPDRRT